MIRRFLCAAIGAALVIHFSAAAAEPVVSEELVRLHVVADSDSAEDQELKLLVRDAVLDCARGLLCECESADAAYAILTENLGALESAASACAADNGFDGTVCAQTGVFEFPERDYGGVTVPAGEYRALRVTIGSGEGQNWWCVLYPTLCVSAEGGYYSALAEWFAAWWGGADQ